MAEQFVADVDYHRNHAALVVKDLQASLRFYQEELGLPLVFRVGPEDNPRTVFLAGIQLTPSTQAVTGDLNGSFNHVGICVTNLEALCARLGRRGINPEVPLERRDLAGTGHTVTLAMYRDPDGNLVELFRLD